jgi:HSP20 family protein
MYSLTRQDPLASRLEGLFGELFNPAWNEARTQPLPLRVDVRETPESYVVLAELPGVKKDAIQVEIEGDEVSIAAEIARAAEAKEGDKWLRLERFHGRTERRFALPQEIDAARADAKFTDGVLELTLPKKAPAGGRKIAVQ